MKTSRLGRIKRSLKIKLRISSGAKRCLSRVKRCLKLKIRSLKIKLRSFSMRCFN